jgi:hypothetical protein
MRCPHSGHARLEDEETISLRIVYSFGSRMIGATNRKTRNHTVIR